MFTRQARTPFNSSVRASYLFFLMLLRAARLRPAAAGSSKGNRSGATSVPAGDEHGDALDPGAERARSHDCARAARFRVHRLFKTSR